MARITTAYGHEFEQHFIDHGIYPIVYEHPDGRPTPKPGNLGDLRRRLAAPRASLSPSQFDESKFDDFQREIMRPVGERRLMRTVVPVLGGTADILNEQDVLFTRLAPITDGTIPRPMPDYFDGARRQDICGTVRNDLMEVIMPTARAGDPVLPNFFLEVKGSRGDGFVARRQACYDGAIGARAMHSLQNYRRNEPIYDGNAYNISSTFCSGLGALHVYAHHPTKPATPGERPEYHMTQVNAYAMTSDRDTCVKGLTAFRNARDWAKEQRDRFIEAANARAWGLEQVTPLRREDAKTEIPRSPVDNDNYAASREANDGPSFPGYNFQDSRRSGPIYDNNAYTLSTTYHDGQLRMYAHHLTKPATPGDRPEHHMTQVNNAYAMTSDRDACVDGPTAFRNARDRVKEQRDRLIEAASREANDRPALPQCLPTEDDAKNNQGYAPLANVGEPPTSFATGFTPSFSTQTRSKRPRTSQSPSSNPRQRKKRRSKR